MKKGGALFLALCMTLALGGCSKNIVFSDMRESDQIELVRTVGVDKRDGNFIVTASMSGAGQSDDVTVLSSEAESVSAALKNMQNYSTKKYIFYGHVKELVVGEGAAREDMNICMEYIERGVEMRLDTQLYIVKGATAKELITWASSEGENVGSLLESLEKDVQLVSESHVFTCGETVEEIAQDGNALAAAIEIVDEEGIVSGENSKIVRSAGYAVIIDNRLAAFVDTENSRGISILANKALGDMTSVSDGNGGWLTLEMSECRADYDGEFEDGRLKKIIIDVSVNGNIAEMQSEVDIYNKEEMDFYERELAALELRRIKNVIELSRELDCDIMKIGKSIELKHPIKAECIKQDVDGAYADAEIEISVRAKIDRTYTKEILKGGNGRHGG